MNESQINAETIFSYLEEICAIGLRRTGTEGETKTGEWLADKFSAAGLETSKEPVNFNCFEASAYNLVILGEETLKFASIFPVWYSRSTGPEGIEGELVYVDTGKAEDFSGKDVAGKIVVGDVVRWKSYMNVNGGEIYRRALMAGAKGVVLIEPHPANHITPHTLKVGRGYDPIESFPQLPALVMGKHDGAALRSRMEKGGLRARLVLDATIKPTSGNNICAVLPGKTREAILVTSPHDSFNAGATDSGTGLACLAAIAQHFASRGQPEKTLFFLSTMGHYAGGEAGVEGFIDAHRHTEMKDFLVNVHCGNSICSTTYEVSDDRFVDTGKESVRTVFTSPLPYLSAITQEAMAQAGTLDTMMRMPTHILNVGEHLSFDSEGIAVVATMDCPVYFDTPEDTIDKVPKDGLMRMFTFVQAVINGILGTPINLLKTPYTPDPRITTGVRALAFLRPESVTPKIMLVPPPQVQISQDKGRDVTLSVQPVRSKRYLWVFGDGSEPILTRVPQCAYTYDKPGKYAAEVFGLDLMGNAARTRVEVEIIT